MERESFEDEATAALMNQHFVSIKVDREERPDLDAIYMDAVQAMTGQGGWPLSAFLTPEGEPFYAGTYFPPEPRHGMPAFRDLLRGVAEAWRERRAEVVGQGRGSRRRSRRRHAPATGGSLDRTLADAAVAGLRRSFDATWGGFGGAPKFPQPMTLEFLLRRAVRGVDGVLDMVTTTLDRMAGGGIYDQLGGGFARYSTDERWHVPHFEKMLYDNALLLQLYAGLAGDRLSRYRTVATETAEYLLREMQHPEGASTPRRTPTPRASRGGSSRGRGPSSWSSSANRSRGRSGPRPRATGSANTGRRTCSGTRVRAREIGHSRSRPGRSRCRGRRLAAGAV